MPNFIEYQERNRCTQKKKITLSRTIIVPSFFIEYQEHSKCSKKKEVNPYQNNYYNTLFHLHLFNTNTILLWLTLNFEKNIRILSLMILTRLSQTSVIYISHSELYHIYVLPMLLV